MQEQGKKEKKPINAAEKIRRREKRRKINMEKKITLKEFWEKCLPIYLGIKEGK